MFALVESGSITKMLRGNKGITIGDIQYSAAVFSLWSESERNAIGIYTIEIDSNDIVNGSVEGVITADNIAEEITTIFQFEIIFSVVIIPREPRINCNTGN